MGIPHRQRSQATTDHTAGRRSRGRGRGRCDFLAQGHSRAQVKLIRRRAGQGQDSFAMCGEGTETIARAAQAGRRMHEQRHAGGARGRQTWRSRSQPDKLIDVGRDRQQLLSDAPAHYTFSIATTPLAEILAIIPATVRASTRNCRAQCHGIIRRRQSRSCPRS